MLVSSRMSRCVCALAVIAGLLASGHVKAQEGHVKAQESPDRAKAGLRWEEHWPRFHWAEYTTTGVLLTGSILLGVFGPKNEVFWVATNGFDDGVRDGLRLDVAQQGGAGL